MIIAPWLPVFSWSHWLTASLCLFKKSEDGKDNTTLPAISLENREINVTASSDKAEREVNDIMENGTNKRREPIVVCIGHSDTVKN